MGINLHQMNPRATQLPLGILSPAGAVYCRHYPLITSVQDLERICALSHSECGSENKSRPVLCTQRGVLRNRPAYAELVFFGCAWHQRGWSRPLGWNQIFTLRSDGRHFFPVWWGKGLFLVPSYCVSIPCLWKEQCNQLGPESCYFKTSRNLESILSKLAVLNFSVSSLVLMY